MRASCRLLIGEKYTGLLQKSLHRMGFNTIPMSMNPYVATPVAYHADLSFLSFGDTIFAAPHILRDDLPDYLRNHNVRFIREELGPKYPNDVLLNVCLFGKTAILNRSTVSVDVLDYLEENQYRIIHVNQGYANCSCCVVDDHSLICADPGICKTAIENGMQVLQISPGFIYLDGYDYGFIGGSSIRLTDEVLAFSGILDFHPDKSRIYAFLKARNVQPVFLTPDPIFDFGGAVQI